MVEQHIFEFAAQVMERHSHHMESILYYPHPFTSGGVIIVYSEAVVSLPELIAEVYQCALPRGVSLHCLKPSELFELSLPGLFQLPETINEHTHLPYLVKYKGTVLGGRDIRDEIRLPSDAKTVLDNHLEACRVYLRAHGVLRWLAMKKYAVLFEQVDKHLRTVMATALLLHQQWDVETATLPQDFQRAFKDTALDSIWEEFSSLRARLPENDDNACRESAMEAAWLFESFIREMSRYTQ